MALETIFNTTCYTLAHALIWFALGIMCGYALFKPERREKMFKVIEWDMGLPYPINEKGQPDKYTPPKLFKTREDAQKWIDKHSYKGMSFKYDIEEA